MEAAGDPLCFDTIFPCQEVSFCDCAPTNCIIHLGCYNEYLHTQGGFVRIRCPVCRQFELGESEWIELSTIFDFDPDYYESVQQLPAEAQEYARRFQRGDVTLEQFRARADAAYEARYGPISENEA